MNDQKSKRDIQATMSDFPEIKRAIFIEAGEPTIQRLCDRITKGKLKAAHDFQRRYVWENKPALKSRLIESIFLGVPIPPIYTAEESDGKELVIDGQQRLLTFHAFRNNEFRLRGLTTLDYLNHKNYKALGEIRDGYLQDKFDEQPVKMIKILENSDPEVKYDVFQRLNKGSVKLNDQELRNCAYRGTMNDFLKEIAKDKDFQILLGSKKHERMQDVELALRFFSLYNLTYHKYNSPMQKFMNSFMRKFQNIESEKLADFKKIFRKSVTLARTVFGDNAFKVYTLKDSKMGKYETPVNKGLFSVLMVGFTQYEKNQVILYKDALKEELLWLLTNDQEFLESNTGTGTDNTDKVHTKFEIWNTSLKEIIGKPKIEPRCFSWEIKKELWEKNPVCQMCKQQIESIDDSEVDHIEFYWRGGKTIPENARLVHRFCNRSRKYKLRKKSNT